MALALSTLTNYSHYLAHLENARSDNSAPNMATLVHALDTLVTDQAALKAAHVAIAAMVGPSDLDTAVAAATAAVAASAARIA